MNFVEEHLEECPVCGTSRWKVNNKGKKIPHKVLRYFPLKPRLQRLFMSSKTAEGMRWHQDKRINDEKELKHPADAKVWKEFDKEHSWFAQDAYNVNLMFVELEFKRLSFGFLLQSCLGDVQKIACLAPVKHQNGAFSVFVQVEMEKRRIDAETRGEAVDVDKIVDDVLGKRSSYIVGLDSRMVSEGERVNDATCPFRF
ncbi:hypothetical protein BUALT_Bualt05G0112400 [Buddleja alternifolia]|uniref:Uncharacterized protein n=1 Tax=Buddleja alternifolia TaxID=168488 RepID=A0AAV6XMR1_9LAMI|nr:hypothetical protein BUALT_Bualt05G0112400 [Buddleja alternifolia]